MSGRRFKTSDDLKTHRLVMGIGVSFSLGYTYG